MRLIELQLHKEAMEKSLSRKIINLSLDNNAQLYRSYCEISCLGDVTATYIYLPAQNLNEEDACRIIMACLTAYYNGENFDKTRQALIDEALSKSEKSDTADSKKETENKPESAKPKRATRKKATTKKAAAKSEQVEEKSEETGEDNKEEKPKTNRKKKTEKFINYDRVQDEHKKELSKILNSHFPVWTKDKELMLKAKEVSEQLVGVALFDSKGEVVPTFEKEVVRLMGGME